MTRFPSTLWSVIDDARGGAPEALEAFVQGYRPAVVAWLSRQGHAGDAEDLAQEVFLRLLTGGVLARIDPRQGRFRSLVLAVARNVLGHHVERRLAAKRGGGRVERLGEREPPSPEVEEREFDEEWARLLLGRALGRLESENARYHGIVRLASEDVSHDEIGRQLGLSKTQVKDALYRSRKRLAALVRDEVREYCSAEEDLQAELRRLGGYLPAPGS